MCVSMCDIYNAVPVGSTNALVCPYMVSGRRVAAGIITLKPLQSSRVPRMASSSLCVCVCKGIVEKCMCEYHIYSRRETLHIIALTHATLYPTHSTYAGYGCCSSSLISVYS
jgi:hypothetical protein